VVLIGNSLGGPVALEAARLLPGRVVAVVAVDTCHDLSVHPDPAVLRARAEAFRKDFAGSCAAMARRLFHPDTDPKLLQDVERRFCRNSPDVVVALMEAFATYDLQKAAEAARVPIRCLNGDLYPTQVEANRKVVADFEAVVFPHTGHFPMLEQPAEFNRRLEELVEQLDK
jgi:pimeloyl-ACP methyl ester carboxylesterase